MFLDYLLPLLLDQGHFPWSATQFDIPFCINSLWYVPWLGNHHDNTYDHSSWSAPWKTNTFDLFFWSCIYVALVQLLSFFFLFNLLYSLWSPLWSISFSLLTDCLLTLICFLTHSYLLLYEQTNVDLLFVQFTVLALICSLINLLTLTCSLINLLTLICSLIN
jgi:hypothetical protein